MERRVARATKYRQLSGAVRCVVTGPSGRGYVRVKRTHLWHCPTSRRRARRRSIFLALRETISSTAARGGPKGMRPNRPQPKWRGLFLALRVRVRGRPLSFRSRGLRRPSWSAVAENGRD